RLVLSMPSTAQVGVDFDTQPYVELKDQFGNTIVDPGLEVSLQSYSEASCTSAVGNLNSAADNIDTSDVTFSGSNWIGQLSLLTNNKLYLKASATGYAASECQE